MRCRLHPGTLQLENAIGMRYGHIETSTNLAFWIQKRLSFVFVWRNDSPTLLYPAGRIV